MCAPRFVRFAVGAGDQRLQVLMNLGRGGEGRDFRQVGHAALVEIMEALQLLDWEIGRGLVLEAVEHRFQLVPIPALAGDKFAEVENHSSCRCLTCR